MTTTLMTCLVDHLLAFSTEDDDLIDPDYAIQLCESTFAQLREMGSKDKAALRRFFRRQAEKVAKAGNVAQADLIYSFAEEV